jgi:GT2 family glycosyltransferase/Tfp pilus assembly protein PilF
MHDISEPVELFCRKIREGNVIFETNLHLANLLLQNDDPPPTKQNILMAEYCLSAAHAQRPFDAQVLENLIHLSKVLEKTAGLSELVETLTYVKATNSDNGRLKIGLNYLQKNQSDKAEKYLHTADAVSNMELLFTCVDALVARNDFDAALNLFRQSAAGYQNTKSVAAHFWRKFAHTLLAAEAPDQAMDCLHKSLDCMNSAAALKDLGQACCLMGQRDKAMKAWRESLVLDPLQIPLYLKLYDVFTGHDRLWETDPDRFRTNILMYTYNKHNDVKKTLKSLAETDIGSAGIIILDNHCTDGTSQLLEKAQNLFPRNKVTIINLPVNIGAPAARNWLMARPENDDTDFLAFLDDDVLLPRDWLKQLIGTINTHPKAAIAGTKVNDEGIPKTIQYIYRFLDVIQENKLILSSKHPGEIDVGQFDFIRKCLSVMGCCHLLRTKTAKDVGEFDIRFSPSQVDDIDHDFLTCLQGHEIVYNGHISVVHCQKAGKEAFLSRPALGNVMGNDYKLAMKHSTEDMRRLKKQTEDIDRSDIRKKIHELRQAGCLDQVPEVPFNVV